MCLYYAGHTSRIATTLQQLTLGEASSILGTSDAGSSLRITLREPAEEAQQAEGGPARAAPASEADAAAVLSADGAPQAAEAAAEPALADRQEEEEGGSSSGSDSEGESEDEAGDDGGWVTAARTKNVQRRQQRRVGGGSSRVAEFRLLRHCTFPALLFGAHVGKQCCWPLAAIIMHVLSNFKWCGTGSPKDMLPQASCQPPCTSCSLQEIRRAQRQEEDRAAAQAAAAAAAEAASDNEDYLSSNDEEESSSDSSSEEEADEAGSQAPAPDSAVCSVTADFAMQNVLLQMGLRLATPDGRRVSQLSRWVLRCTACFAVTKVGGRGPA